MGITHILKLDEQGRLAGDDKDELVVTWKDISSLGSRYRVGHRIQCRLRAHVAHVKHALDVDRARSHRAES